MLADNDDNNLPDDTDDTDDDEGNDGFDDDEVPVDKEDNESAHDDIDDDKFCTVRLRSSSSRSARASCADALKVVKSTSSPSISMLP